MTIPDAPGAQGAAPLTALYEQALRERGYRSDTAQAAVVGRLEQLRARIADPGPWWRRLGGARAVGTRGLYLYGDVGRGKTWLMDLFFASLAPLTGERQHFHHFMRDTHAALRAAGARRDPLAWVAHRIAQRARVLCLDELYVHDIADAMVLAGLFGALLEAGVWLVVTSNAAPSELYRDGLQRSRFLPAIALLERELELVHLDGDTDYRLRQLRQHSLYLDSALPGSEAELDRLFGALSSPDGERETALTVLGRTINARRRAGDVVWFEFDALCEGARSYADYVEIASEFHTVLVSAIPVFDTPARDDAARRFIALIDELYDQGVKLIVSAAAEPGALYTADRLRGDFRRTASRLLEMRGDAYLARPRRS